MIKVTYLITVYNKERYIAKVIESLKNIKGVFGKEFIFIDDGSTDLSLKLIKQHSTSLKNTIIVTQQNQGPALAINKGINLARGDYIFFLDGDDLISEEGSALLLKACSDLNADVAFGLRGKYDAKTGEKWFVIARRSLDRRGNLVKFFINIVIEYITGLPRRAYAPRNDDQQQSLIDSPISALLAGKISRIRSIGSSGSLVKLDLLKKIGGCDEKVFVQDFSLSLRCALYSNFVHVNKATSFEPISYDTQNLSSNKKFESYNSLKALFNFIESNKQIAEQHKVELHQLLWSIMWKLNKYDYKIFYKYIIAKYFKPQITIDKLLTVYKNNIVQLS